MSLSGIAMPAGGNTISIGIIGLGTVGGAMYRGFKAAGCEVLGYDIDHSRSPDTLDDTLQQGLILVSVPTPADADGNCDLSAIHGALDSAAILGAGGPLVLRSTVPVGTTDRLIAAYPSLKIGYSPEFLRAGSADHDFLHPPMTVYGGACPEPYFAAMKAVHGPGAGNQAVLSTTEAELLKLLLNGFAAMKTVFSSEMARLARTANADWNKIIAIAQLEGRLGAGYLEATGPDGQPGFAGNCLPKDCRMLIQQLGAGNLLGRVMEINGRLRDS